MTAPIVLLTPEQLSELIEQAVARALTAHEAKSARPPRASARLTVDEAAAELRCNPRHVRRLVSLGRLRAAKIGTGGRARLLIDRSDIETLLQESAT